MSGVYLARGAPWTYRARLWAAVLATGGVLGFGTGSHLWGVLDEQPARLEIVLPPARRVQVSRDIRIVRVFTPASALTRCSGLPITSRTWTLLDQIGSMAPAAAQRLTDRAMQRGWITGTDLERRLRDYPCRRGNRQLRIVLATTSDGAAAASERLLHRLLREAGITGWQPNHPVWVDGDLAAVVDIAFPAARLAIEVDGRAYHVDVDRFQRDRQRQNGLVACGWTVLRFTWSDLIERPGYVVVSIQGQLSRDRGV